MQDLNYTMLVHGDPGNLVTWYAPQNMVSISSGNGLSLFGITWTYADSLSI